MLSPKAGNESALVWFDLTSKSFPIWRQLPSLRISPASHVPPAHLQLLLPTSECPWCQQISVWRTHLSPSLLHSFQGSSSPFLQEALCTYDFPPQSTSHIKSQLSITLLLQGRNHCYPCNKMAPFPVLAEWTAQSLRHRTLGVSAQDGRRPSLFYTDIPLLHYSTTSHS